MWNSNSVTGWLISSTGLDAERVRLPANGHAPGWHDGIAVAAATSSGGRSASHALGAATTNQRKRVMRIVSVADAFRARARDTPAMSGESILVAESVRKVYRSGGDEVVALHDLDLTV